jgi:hypothetical protein
MADESDSLVLRHLRELRADMTKRFDTMEARLDKRFDEVEVRIVKIEARLSDLTSRPSK